jgi:hypothetical protein
MLSFLSSQSASANIPEAARLIGNGGEVYPQPSGTPASCKGGIRGITSDGTYVYFRTNSDSTVICQTTLTGVFVAANPVAGLSPTYSSEQRALTYANGCILFRNSYIAGSGIMCIDTSSWTLYGPFTPSGASIPLGGGWLTSNIMNFPDGRIGAVSAPTATLGAGGGSGANACPANMYCKILRLYNVSRSGNILTISWSEDVTLADPSKDTVQTSVGWPSDDHGMATDGTYLYQIKHEYGYKVWELKSGTPSFIIFNGDGTGACKATTGVTGTLCPIYAPKDGSTRLMTNATYFGRSHLTNQYIMGDYDGTDARFWISKSVAPPAGIGSDVTAPVLSAQSASSITQTTATLNFTSGEAGTYFYLIYPSATSAPDSTTVVNQGASAPTVVKGTSSATASANAVSVTGLSAGTAYKAYVVVRDSSGNVSLVSTISLTTVVASPAFTLSSSSETRTYATSGTAFTINSTGGLIASFSISATPPGMSFDTSTGALTGAPTTIAAATSYTVTATNVSGTATRSFVLTVTARPITIKAANKSASYSGSSVSVSNSYSITSGALAGLDSFTALTYTYSSAGYSASQTAPTNAGTYTITPSAASFSSGLASNYNITYETATLTIAPGLPQAPSFPQATLKVIVDNDYAIFMGDDANATRLFYQNNVDWYTQVPTAASLDITAQAGETYIYIVTMGGGGTEDFAGTLNGQDVLNIPGAQVASSRSPIGTAVVSGPYVKLESYISGYNASAVAAGTQNVTLAGLQSALTGAVWSSAVAIGAGNGNVPYYKSSGSVACGTAATTGLSGNCWDFPSNSAVVFRYPLSSLTLPVRPSVGSVTVDWTASESTTAAANAPTGYVVQYKRTIDPDSSFTTFTTTAADTTIATVTGLTSGDDYSFRVAATNATGLGSYSVTKTSTPATLPVVSSFTATTVATTTSFTFNSDKAGTFYALVYESASAAPNASTLIAQSISAPTIAKSTSIAGYGATTFSVSGLTAGVSYKGYVIVQDSAQNNSEVSVISFIVQGAFTVTSISGTYGTTLRLTTSGGSGAGAVSYTTGTAGCSITNTDSLTVTSAQTCSVTAVKAANSTFLQITSSATNVVFAARPITIKAADKSTTYSGATASVSNSYTITSGTLAGLDSFTALTYTFTSVALSYNSQTAPTNAAAYTITPSAASFSVGSASNYSITYATGTLTINKADSITVTASPSTTTYNASPITSAYVVSGLKGAETATATSNFLGINGTTYGGSTSCASGGTCSVGDLAPGGGYVFYVSATTINVAAGISDGGIYLATAPQTWNGGVVDPNASWGCGGTTISGSFSNAVGSGAENTRLINAGCATAGIASRITADSSAAGFTDWFLPSIDELTLIYNNLKVPGLSNLQSWNYWSSTQSTSNAAGSAKYWWFGSGALSGETDKNNSAGSNMYVRAIRAFSPTVSSTTTTPPTNAGSYRYTVTDIVISAGASLDNYQGVVYESATVTINKAFQAKLSVGQYDAYPGISSYPINVYGGTGLGLVTRTLVDTGTAGCALSISAILTATQVGTCSVRAVKDGGVNYFAETTTATIYWITFINRYSTSGPTTPTDLGLSGSTAIEKRTYEAFTVLSFANGSGTAVTSVSMNSVMRIIGTGFNSSDETTEVIIGFSSIPRSSLTFNTSDPAANYVQFTVPSDLDLGTNDVAMKSRKGWAFAPSLLNVTG